MWGFKEGGKEAFSCHGCLSPDGHAQVISVNETLVPGGRRALPSLALCQSD